LDYFNGSILVCDLSLLAQVSQGVCSSETLCYATETKFNVRHKTLRSLSQMITCTKLVIININTN